MTIQISERELKEFRKKFSSWININLSTQETNNKSDASYGMKLEEQKDTEDWDRLKNMIRSILDTCKKNHNLELIPEIFNAIIETLIESKKNLAFENPLEEFVNLYLDIVKEFIGSNLTSIYQFSPEIFNYISNEIAKHNIELKWVNFNYWKEKIFDNMEKSDKNIDVLFSLRSMINFIKYKNEKEKRLKQI